MAMKFTGAFRPIGKLISREAPSNVVIVPPIVLPPLAFTATPTITGNRVGDQYKVNWSTNRVPDTVTYEWRVGGTGGTAAKFALNQDTYYPNAVTTLECRVTATIGTETVRAISPTKGVGSQSGTQIFTDGFEGTGTWAVNFGAATFPTSALALGGTKLLRMDPVASGNPTDLSSIYFGSNPNTTNYRVRVWARGLDSPTQLRVLIYSRGAYPVNNRIDLTTEWKPYDLFFSTSSSMLVRLISGAINSPSILVDNVSVHQV